MSFPLPSVDLSTAIVGTTGKISLNNVGISAGGPSNNPAYINKPDTLFFFNDSGCGLQITFSQGGSGFNLPAGAWVPMALPPGENSLSYRVLYVLPNPPVSLLLLTYYDASETIPQSMTLGNSPVGIGGSVQTSSVQTLSNEGGAAGGLVVDIGDVTISQLIKLWTDHFSIRVDQSGTAHTVLQGNTSGNPLQIGQAGDVSEVLGKLTVDQAVSFLSTLAVTSTSSLDNGLITTDGSGNITGVSIQTSSVNSPSASLNIGVPTGDRINFVVNGVVIAYMDGTGLHFASSTSNISWRTSGNVARWDSANFTAPTMTYPGSFTFTHNFGYVPDSAWVMPGTSANLTGSCTVGVWDWLSNTCVITLGAQINGILWYKKNT